MLIISVAEYRARRVISEVLHEYAGGEAYAMAGAGNVNNNIPGNVFAALHNHLDGSPCVPEVSGMQVKVKAATEELFYDPDVRVACDPGDHAKLYRAKPVLIVEVSSPETTRIDARKKNRPYQTIPPADVYVIVPQTACAITVYRRATGRMPEVFTDPAGSLEVEPLKFSAPFSKLSARADLA